MSITDVCLRKPVFAWMIMAGTILFGLVAATRIGVSQFPDVDYPTISVSVSWPGAAPEDVETGVVNVLEESLAQVEGVQTITSSSSMGSARITATFDMSRDIDLALQDTQAKIAQAGRQLPQNVMTPVVSKSNPDDQPILTIGVSGPFSKQLLADVARYQVEDRLQTIPGVGQVTLMGYVDRAIRIWVDADKLNSTGLTVTDVINALQKEHVTVPSGAMDTMEKQLSVRVLGEAADLTTLQNIVVKQISGAPIRVKDVALVEDGFQDSNSLARSNGQPVQAMGVLKQRGANAVGVAKAVTAAIGEVQKGLPDGMHVDVIFDTTGFISESIDEIVLELGLALVLTALVCWLFLGSLSSTMNVLFAIPMSLLGTVAVVYFLGYTMNTFTLLGLSLAVGLVVDDAVMVMENIFRHAEMGKSRLQAAGEGTKEITFAALAATLAVIAIFLPVVFMSGIVGKFFLQFGVTLSIAVALSYVEAITLAPARCAQMLNVNQHERTGVGGAVDRGFAALERFYARMLARVLVRPWWALTSAAVILGLAVWTAMSLPGEFVPSQDQSRLQVKLTAAVGTDLAETNRYAMACEAFLAQRPEVKSVMSSVGGGSSTNGASFSVTLVPPSQRKLTQNEVAAAIRKQFSAFPGVRVSVQDLSQQGFTGQRGYPLEFSVRGPDWAVLTAQAQKLRDELTKSGLATDIDTDYQIGSPELQIKPDRARISALGIAVQDVANTVSSLVGGVTIGKYSSAGRRLDVDLKLLANQRTRPEDIGGLRVRLPTGDMVPVSALTSQEEVPVLQAINHADRERAISIFGNVAAGHSQTEALAFVQSLSKDVPTGYRVVLSGQSSQFTDSMNSLLFALGLGILVAYMVLASQFNSFLHPVTVLSILPLSIAGAAFGLFFMHKTLNVFSMIGVLLLMGIVKKNSIILVDYATEQRNAGHASDAKSAMLQAGPVRLRPIVMTSVATMMSAIPSAMGFGPGSETRAPMADAVLGGLILSTALSLLVVPAFYVVADGIKQRLAGRAARAPSPSAHVA
ncbi:MAG TPA: efflux RND transporter permease subunit [Polyangiaceae bacterium]